MEGTTLDTFRMLQEDVPPAKSRAATGALLQPKVEMLPETSAAFVSSAQVRGLLQQRIEGSHDRSILLLGQLHPLWVQARG